MELDSTLLASQTIAIQGELGSNSHMAVRQACGARPFSLVACRTSAEVFDCLAEGTASAAVIPIENSLHGSVFEHYDLLLEHELRIIGEAVLPIRHNLIAAPGVSLDQVKRVTSHPVALSQCRRWLRQHPRLEAVPGYDTAGSVKLLMQAGWRDSAAIAPEQAACEYGAEVLVPGIEDHHENYTRFYLLVPQTNFAEAPAACDKASLAFTLEHRPGTLVAALRVFEAVGLNLSKIESRPVPGRPWEYVFFVDLRFSASDQLDKALEILANSCRMLRELGRYKADSLA